MNQDKDSLLKLVEILQRVNPDVSKSLVNDASEIGVCGTSLVAVLFS